MYSGVEKKRAEAKVKVDEILNSHLDWDRRLDYVYVASVARENGTTPGRLNAAIQRKESRIREAEHQRKLAEKAKKEKTNNE